ncbi:hypothetical protein P692DRAFT_20878510 [Suillus brevipes Sb2]|nr:hypothetical protein P692DRAFT_20878510 [Suillus brevipes Sb2]
MDVKTKGKGKSYGTIHPSRLSPHLPPRPPSPKRTHERTLKRKTITARTHELTRSSCPGATRAVPKAASRAFQLALVPPFIVLCPHNCRISTSDVHILGFGPLQTSPRALDAPVSITDSTKKLAREEMCMLQ